MVDNPDTVKFREFVLKVGFQKGYDVNTEVPIDLGGKLRSVDIVFTKGEKKHYIEIESGGKSGTSYDPKGRVRDIRLVAKASKGFILTKNETGERLHLRTLKQLNSKGQYQNVFIFTWEEYISLTRISCSPHEP